MSDTGKSSQPKRHRNVLLTRQHVLGNGIICGLDFYTDSHCHVHLSQGCGLSSRGHLLCMPEGVFSYYKQYDDPDHYFERRLNREVLIFELFPQPGYGRTPLTPQTLEEIGSLETVPDELDEQTTPSLRDLSSWILFLYLEGDFTEKGCKKRSPDVKVLLIHQHDAWTMMQRSGELQEKCVVIEEEDEPLGAGSIFLAQELPSEAEVYNAVNRRFLLNDIVMPRFGYGTTDLQNIALANEEIYPQLPPETEDDNPFKRIYREYNFIIGKALTDLESGIELLHKYHRNWLNKQQIEYVDAYFRLLLKRRAHYLSRIGEEGHHSIQYFYGFIKDLVDTYNELRAELCDLIAICCPNPKFFPRHLMLGKLQEEINFQLSIYRHYFQQPPIYNGNADRLRKVQFLHWRLVMLIKSFFIPDPDFDTLPEEFENPSDESYADILKDEGESFPDTYQNMPVKITPSRSPDQLLGKQAIPFYYHLSRSYYSLQHYWDYETTKCNEEDHIFSYHASFDDPNSYTQLDFVIKPFAFSIHDYPFYRIEGHLGRKLLGTVNEAGNYEYGALKAILDLRNKFNLTFDLITMKTSDVGHLFDILSDPITESPETGPDLDLVQKRGLEHLAGVPKGGTFILVYNEEDSEVVADFCLPYYCCSPAESPVDDPPPIVLVEGMVCACGDSEALEGAIVRFGPYQTEIPTNDLGEFSLEVLPGTYPVEVLLAGYEIREGEDCLPKTIHIPDPRTEEGTDVLSDLVICMQPETGTIFLESEEDITAIRLLETGNPVPYALLTGSSVDSFCYRLDGLPSGEVTLRIEIANTTPIRLGFTVDPCEEPLYNLNIEESGKPATATPVGEMPSDDPTEEELLNELLEMIGIAGDREDDLSIIGVGSVNETKLKERDIKIYEQIVQIDPENKPRTIELVNQLTGIALSTLEKGDWQEKATQLLDLRDILRGKFPADHEFESEDLTKIVQTEKFTRELKRIGIVHPAQILQINDKAAKYIGILTKLTERQVLRELDDWKQRARNLLIDRLLDITGKVKKTERERLIAEGSNPGLSELTKDDQDDLYSIGIQSFQQVTEFNEETDQLILALIGLEVDAGWAKEAEDIMSGNRS